MTWLLVSGTGALIVYELWAAFHAGGETISEILWTAASHSNAVPFFFGLLMGHLFLRGRVK